MANENNKHFNKFIRVSDNKQLSLCRQDRVPLQSDCSRTWNVFLCTSKKIRQDTLEAIFQGKRELFKGLFIDSTDYEWKTYPIIHIDFGNCQASSASELKGWLQRLLEKIALNYSLKVAKGLPYYETFSNLIQQLSKIGKTVILIDEYDKIISSNIFNPEVDEIREIMRGFFEVIKAQNASTRFVFITGVTKYAKLSVFSSMNNLTEISIDERYATMFGYTQKELESNFADYIESGMKATGMDRKGYLSNLKIQYDGFCFCLDSETVYNPVSIGQFFYFGGKDCTDFWVETGSTKLLMDIVKKVDFSIATDISQPMDAASLRTFDILELASASANVSDLKALLLQSGYLTLKSKSITGRLVYLGFPNEEVSRSFTSSLIRWKSHEPETWQSL